MINRIIGKLKSVLDRNEAKATTALALLKVAELRALRTELAARQPDNLALAGYKVYSQNDEDGVLAAIFEAVVGNRTFLEVGLQDGTECNTLHLLLQGWRGGWIEASAAYCATIRAHLDVDKASGRLQLIEEFVRCDNIAALYRRVCEGVNEQDLALFSLDIDGNDLFVLEKLLASGARPSVICVEYNGKFPPPLSVSVALDEPRGWAGDDYFGASLQAFADLLAHYDYGLLTCNLVGVNAFFIRDGLAPELKRFSPAEVWQPLRLYLAILPASHPPSLKFARDFLAAPATASNSARPAAQEAGMH